MLAAISSMSRYEVLVASTAPGLHTRSSSANTAFLTAMSSNTASTTRSACASASYDGRAGEARHHRGLGLGRHAALRDQAVVDLLDVGAAAREAGLVALDHRHRQAGVEHRHRDAGAHGAAADDAARRRSAAAWRPWSRAPSATSRSAKKAWIRPARCGLSMHCRNSLRSSAMPSSKGRSSAASTASTIFIGENRPRLFFAVSARAASSAARLAARSARAWRVARAAHAAPWRRSAPSRRPGLRPAHRRPRRGGRPGRAPALPWRSTWRPLSIRSSAALAPIRRGARCVPPAAGHQAQLHFGQAELGGRPRPGGSAPTARSPARRRARRRGSRRPPACCSPRCGRRPRAARAAAAACRIRGCRRRR